MEVAIENEDHVIVSGQPRAQRHYDLFKEATKSVVDAGLSPHIVFENAKILPSAYIGFILSLQGKSHKFTIEAKNPQLKQSMEDLKLDHLLANA